MILPFLIVLLSATNAARVSSQSQTEHKNRRIVALIATNDIHGHAMPFHYTRIDDNSTYTQGGLPVLASLIQVVRQQFPGNTLFFDSGDQFQGGLESSPQISGGSLVNKFMDHLKLDGAAIGNHDFDYGYDFLNNYLKGRKGPSLLANVKKGKEGSHSIFANQQISKLYELKNGIKIGTIGMTTKFTPQRSSGWALNDQNLQGLKFQDYTKILVSQSINLRKQGADAVILVSHIGDDCFITIPQYGLWTKDKKQPSCNKAGEINKLMQIIPSGTLDAILQGHYHNIAHNYINDIPIAGNIMGAKYFNVLYLQFQDRKVINTIIEGPIPVCHKVFQHTLRCEYIDNLQELNSSGRLVNWKFHNTKVQPDPLITKMLDYQLGDKMKPWMEIVCYNQKLMKPSYDQQRQLNNLLAMAVRKTSPTADIILLSPSLLRQPFYPGPIRKVDLYNFHPFNSPFVAVKMSGKTFISTLSFLQTLPDSYNFSNELWQQVWMTQNREKRGLSKVKWYNGSQIDAQRQLSVIVHNFTLSFVIGKYNITKIESFGIVRDVFEDYLRKLGKIRAEDVFINPKKPHMVVKELTSAP